MLGSTELLGWAKGEVVGHSVCRELIDGLARLSESVGTGWGMNSNVLYTVTSALVLVWFVEPWMEDKACDVKLAGTFALRLLTGTVPVPDAALEVPDDVEVRGELLAACSPTKLRVEYSHKSFTDCILVNIYSDGSGGITRGVHYASDDGSAPLNRTHPPDQYEWAKSKQKKKQIERVYCDDNNRSSKGRSRKSVTYGATRLKRVFHKFGDQQRAYLY